jgi:hypothetical protein
MSNNVCKTFFGEPNKTTCGQPVEEPCHRDWHRSSLSSQTLVSQDIWSQPPLKTQILKEDWIKIKWAFSLLCCCTSGTAAHQRPRVTALIILFCLSNYKTSCWMLDADWKSNIPSSAVFADIGPPTLYLQKFSTPLLFQPHLLLTGV